MLHITVITVKKYQLEFWSRVNRLTFDQRCEGKAYNMGANIGGEGRRCGQVGKGRAGEADGRAWRSIGDRKGCTRICARTWTTFCQRGIKAERASLPKISQASFIFLLNLV